MRKAATTAMSKNCYNPPSRRAAARFMITSAYSWLPALFIIVFPDGNSLAAADRIMLRDLTVLRDRSVRDLSEDGVRLDDDRLLTWDLIEKGKCKQQADFDQLLQEIGEPLYRIRQRLKVGDYLAASEPAEQLYARYLHRESESAYLVMQATMWSRLNSGRREAAIPAYISCCRLLRRHNELSQSLPGSRRMILDAATGFTPEILPVWFDASAAKKAMPDVKLVLDQLLARDSEVDKSATEWFGDGIRLCVGTLALTAGETKYSEEILQSMCQTGDFARQLQRLGRSAVAIQAEKYEIVIAELSSVETWPSHVRPVVHYWTGLAKVSAPSRSSRLDGILELLHIPALDGSTQPELASAALFHAANACEAVGDAAGSAAIRKELRTRYPSTPHGRQSQNSKSTDLTGFGNSQGE